MNPFLQLALLPFSALYGAGVKLRNLAYDKGIFKSQSFKIPTIVVGNLTTGGSGKTPHVECIIRLLKDQCKLATLSRGYGRKTKGFLLAKPTMDSSLIGDEPKQYAHKFNDITVSVGEDRVQAISQLLELPNKIDVVVLDDAFQHRKLIGGLNILLIEYRHIYMNNYLLPAGTLREPLSCKKRADIIVISKCPTVLSPLEKKQIQEKLALNPNQSLYFSYIKYGDLLPTWDTSKPIGIGKDYYFERNYSFILMAGIARPDLFESYFKDHSGKVHMVEFPDHHDYSLKDLQKVKKIYDDQLGQNKIIVTTEKDFMRLQKPALAELFNELKIFYLPIEVAFHNGDQAKFENQILTFAKGKG